MQNYKTIEEKAAEWNVSLHYIQYLCRKGKIDGAVKRAGAWFIPDGVPTPIKYTKANTGGFKFVGTKSGIFDNAIELFKSKGFNDVSMKDIADNVGIQKSAVYNHFSSKQEILDTIYDFYCYYYLLDRPSMEDMEAALQNESPIDIIGYIRYDFKEDYQQKMSDITKIVLQRISVDDRARQISKSLVVDEGVQYVEDVFNKGIEIGRFAPFDTHSMSVLINSVRIFTLYNWIVDPSADNMMKIAEVEQELYKFVAGFLTDLKPVT